MRVIREVLKNGKPDHGFRRILILRRMIGNPVVIHSEDKPIKDMKDFDNYKENNEAGDGVSNFSSNPSSISAKLRAAVLGLTSAAVFKYTFLTSVIIALAAGIIYYTASDTKHVNIDKVDTATVVLSG